MVASSYASPAKPAASPEGAVLYPGVAWTNLGASNQTLNVGNTQITLPGTAHQYDEFGAAVSPRVFDYYTNKLGKSGWTELRGGQDRAELLLGWYYEAPGQYLTVRLVPIQERQGATQNTYSLRLWASDASLAAPQVARVVTRTPTPVPLPITPATPQSQNIGLGSPLVPATGQFAPPTDGYMGRGWQPNDPSYPHKGIDIWTNQQFSCACPTPGGCDTPPGNVVRTAYDGTVAHIYYANNNDGPWIEARGCYEL